MCKLHVHILVPDKVLSEETKLLTLENEKRNQDPANAINKF